MKTWQEIILEITETEPADTSDTSNIFISYDDLAAILQAALAEPSEPVAWMKAGEGDYEKAFSWNFSEKTGYTIPLYPQPTTNHLDEIAKVLHYPECWDTAAYPTLEDAIIEAKSWAHCTNEDCQCPTKEAR